MLPIPVPVPQALSEGEEVTLMGWGNAVMRAVHKDAAGQVTAIDAGQSGWGGGEGGAGGSAQGDVGAGPDRRLLPPPPLAAQRHVRGSSCVSTGRPHVWLAG